jgi:hypothetical protein
MAKHFTLASEIVDLLGGTAVVARWQGIGMQAVSDWKRKNRLPPERIYSILDALEELDPDHTVDVDLLSQKFPETVLPPELMP